MCGCETLVTVLSAVSPTMGTTSHRRGGWEMMFKLIVTGGLLGLVGLAGVTLTNVLMGVIGLGIALFVLAIGLEVVAGLIERTTRRTSGIQYAYSRRLERDRPAA